MINSKIKDDFNNKDILNTNDEFSVLDSISKGGAHVTVQNMNLIFGQEETEGLKRQGLYRINIF